MTFAFRYNLTMPTLTQFSDRFASGRCTPVPFVLTFLMMWVVAAASMSNASARTFYVSTGGSDNRSDGDAQNGRTPWRTINRAVRSSRGGDTIVVFPGTYYEDVYIDRSGYGGGDLIIKSESKEAARLVGSFVCNDQSYVTIDGFDVSNYRNSFPTKGIQFNRCHHVTVQNCRVRECWGGGIAFDQSDWILCQWNIVHGNAYYNPDQHSGISVYQPEYRGDDSRKFGIIIRNNTSFANQNLVNNRFFGRPTDGNGIVVDDYLKTQGSGGVPYNRMTLIENNICFSNGGQGIHCYSSQNIRIRNNTCVGNLNSFDFGGEISVVQSERVYVYNNIMVANPGKRSVLQYQSRDFAIFNNVLDGPTQDVGFDALSTYGSPRFESNSFRLSGQSPAVNRGFNFGDHFGLDAYGQNRFNGQIDLGAIER